MARQSFLRASLDPLIRCSDPTLAYNRFNRSVNPPLAEEIVVSSWFKPLWAGKP